MPGFIEGVWRKGCRPSCMIKMDMGKAYDTIEWSFVREMLVCLKFPQKFIKLVMTCVTSTRCFLMINGNLFGFFNL